MGRKPKGSVYESSGSLYLSITLDKRRHFRITACRTIEEAELRRALIVDLVIRLKAAGRLDIASRFCKSAAEADEHALPRLLTLVQGVLSGSEQVEAARCTQSQAASATMTFGDFAELWVTNELTARYRGRVKVVGHDQNVQRLRKHVYPIVFAGRTIEDTPLEEISLDHGDHVLRQPTLPEGSLRHVAQIMQRIMKLAVYPARLLKQSPFPPGWLPSANKPKERSYVFPEEEAKLMAHVETPLVWRLFFGFCVREGMRKENAVTLLWENLTLDLPQSEGHVVLDRTKNGRGGSWRLDPGTAEALRRWMQICPSKRAVFPTEALPRYRRRRAGDVLHVGQAAATLRKALAAAGVDRPKLYQHGPNRLRLRLHDLRATFVTLALGKGETEDWVIRRTGHLSSAMVARYRRDAETAAELNLGWLQPLHEVIPELRDLRLADRPRPKLVVLPGGAPEGGDSTRQKQSSG